MQTKHDGWMAGDAYYMVRRNNKYLIAHTANRFSADRSKCQVYFSFDTAHMLAVVYGGIVERFN